MEKQLLAPIGLATDARFIMPLMSEKAPSWLTRSEAKMAERLIKNGISAIADIADTQVALGALDRLISKRLAQLSCFTPTDAVHILGSFNIYNKKAAILGAQLLARQKDNKGQMIAKSAEALSQICLDKLSFLSALKISDAAIAEDDGIENTASNTPAIKAALSKRTQQSRLLQHDIRLLSPIIALGASAKTHYPHIAERLNTSLVIPEYAEVAGAIGAAISSIHQYSSITITQPQEGVFRVHLTTGIEDFQMLDEAIERAKQAATIVSEQKAAKAGATKTKLPYLKTFKELNLALAKACLLKR